MAESQWASEHDKKDSKRRCLWKDEPLSGGTGVPRVTSFLF